MIRSSFARTGLAAALALAAASPAFALDGRDFADTLAAAFEANAVTVAFANAEASGDTVTLSGISIAPAGEDAVELDAQITFSGVSENPDGSYDVARAESRDITIPNEGFTLSIGGIAVENLRVDATPADNPLEMAKFYERFEMTGAALTAQGREVVTIESVTASNVPGDDAAELVSSYAVTGIHAEPGSIGIAEIAGMVAALGLEVIDAHMQGEGVWNVETGRMEVTESSITVENAGALDFTFTLDGYDLDLLGQTMALNRELTDDPTPEEMAAKSAEIADLMSANIKLVSAAIRFEDNSITNKIIDLFAGMNGAPREAMVAGFAAAAPAKAAEMGLSEELQAELGNAASAFLADPRSFEISVAPDAPVSFAEISAQAEDPAATEALLNIAVKANQ